jgi:hypothetical protein
MSLINMQLVLKFFVFLNSSVYESKHYMVSFWSQEYLKSIALICF